MSHFNDVTKINKHQYYNQINGNFYFHPAQGLNERMHQIHNELQPFQFSPQWNIYDLLLNFFKNKKFPVLKDFLNYPIKN